MEDWEYELAPVLAAIRPAAARFRKWAQGRVDPSAAADCELALVEACNNVINHNPGNTGMIHLCAQATPFEISITIRDDTSGFDWPVEPSLPGPDEESGRGIFLMHALMTAVDYKRKPGANELRLRRQL